MFIDLFMYGCSSSNFMFTMQPKMQYFFADERQQVLLFFREVMCMTRNKLILTRLHVACAPSKDLRSPSLIKVFGGDFVGSQ